MIQPTIVLRLTSRSSPYDRKERGDTLAIPGHSLQSSAEELRSSRLRFGHGSREEYRARADSPHRVCLAELPKLFHQPGRTGQMRASSAMVVDSGEGHDTEICGRRAQTLSRDARKEQRINSAGGSTKKE